MTKSTFFFRMLPLLMVLILLGGLFGCGPKSTDVSQTGDSLFNGFQSPPANARPFVRWWWNGNHLDKDEIVRQLDVLQKAGIGGVEINPIAMPQDAPDIGTKPLTWLSKEWNEMLKFASAEAQKRGMMVDLIVGSGWPFGGEFLSDEETIQRIIVNKIPCSGGEIIKEDLNGLYKKAVAALSRNYEAAKSREMVFVRLVPVNLQSTSEITDLTAMFKSNNQLDYTVPPGKYDLVYGILQRGNREVMHGAPGAAGPVMNHYEKDITRAYLNRLNKIVEDTGTPLSELVRALFCDSIELDGANWTDGFGEIFFATYNYNIEPWFPFVFYDPYTGYKVENYSPEFLEEIKRVRYDYNKLLVELFLKNFTQEFRDFCTENGVLCRYQAYGTPFLMGMMEGNMIADIPESNNWIYSSDMDAVEWTWNQGHGYMIWNMYAASGGHLTGKKIISNEAMTNTRGVFKASLEEIKLHDDMNFITGMNHSVLHGYNYSPPKAGFPGWVRFGSYFSEQNTWWPYFPEWTMYNARLSYVFQQSQPVKNIAVLAPEADIWTNHGLTRNQYHTQPWYGYRIWEPISQAGSSADYISQKIIRESTMENGTLSFGPMTYQAIFLCSIRSLEPDAALALLKFVQNGGKLVVIDGLPQRSLSFQNASANDSIVKSVFNTITKDYPKQLFQVKSPEAESDLLPWAINVLEQVNIQTDVKIDTPDKNVFQIRKKADGVDIYFLTNTNRTKQVTIDAIFPVKDKTPWIWNPEEGKRNVFPAGKNKNELSIVLSPLQSLLLVFDADDSGDPFDMQIPPAGTAIQPIEGPWQVRFDHVNGGSFERSFESLSEFGTSQSQALNSFAGVVTYSGTFNSDGAGEWIRLGDTNKGVTEVLLNGKSVGLNWYGEPLFNIKGALRNGENLLEIKYTTVLSNYVMSLENNPTAAKWTAGYRKIPVGLSGNPVIF